MLQNLRNEYAKAISRWQVKNPDLDYLSIWKSYNPNTWTEEQLNGLSIEHTLWCCDNSKCKKGVSIRHLINISIARMPLSLKRLIRMAQIIGAQRKIW